MLGNYERVLEKIAGFSGLEKEEIERRVEAKRAKLSGLISQEGAAQIVAAELGINFDDQKLKIDELLPGMRKVNVVGKVITLFPVREFTTKKGDKGKVVNFFLGDDSSNVKVVLWDTNHIDFIEKGEIKEGSVIEIGNASMRDNELHLGSFSEFKPSQEVMDNVVTERVVKEKTISGLVVGDNSRIRAFIVQSFEPRFFYVCPECKKKAVSGEGGFICEKHGTVTADKRALINVVLDDGTETIRSVIFHDHLNDLGITELEDVERMINQREDLLGKEMVFEGNVRMNKFFNNPEFIINGVKTLNLDEVLASLEKQLKV